jgi:aspartate/methionine/tyrosine aminotransferase
MDLVRPEIEALADSPIVEVWKLGFTHPGTIGMWAGESDLPTPAFICDAASASLAAGHTFYTHNRGIPELRAELQHYYRRLHGVAIADERLAVTGSGMNAVMLIAQALVRPGDNVVAISPSWPNILRTIEIMGGQTREVALTSTESGWTLDLDALFDACDDRTRMIYFASPGNPTGWLLERPQAEAILDFCRARNIAIMADEVYHRIVYDRPVALSMLELATPEDPVFVVNTFSKSWAMTGWRLGWMVYPAGWTGVFDKLIQYNTSGTPAFLQAGCTVALRDGDPFVEWFVARCRGGWRMVSDRLSNMPRVHLVPNVASFYVMFSIDGVSDTLDFCKRAVMEARIGLAPGMAFGGGADRHIRLCYAQSDELLDTAMTRLQAFVADYREA